MAKKKEKIENKLNNSLKAGSYIIKDGKRVPNPNDPAMQEREKKDSKTESKNEKS